MQSDIVRKITTTLSKFGEQVLRVERGEDSICAVYTGKALDFEELKELEAIAYPHVENDGLNTLIPFGFKGEYSLTFHGIG